MRIKYPLIRISNPIIKNPKSDPPINISIPLIKNQLSANKDQYSAYIQYYSYKN